MDGTNHDGGQPVSFPHKEEICNHLQGGTFLSPPGFHFLSCSLPSLLLLPSLPSCCRFLHSCCSFLHIPTLSTVSPKDPSPLFPDLFLPDWVIFSCPVSQLLGIRATATAFFPLVLHSGFKKKPLLHSLFGLFWKGVWWGSPSLQKHLSCLSLAPVCSIFDPYSETRFRIRYLDLCIDRILNASGDGRSITCLSVFITEILTLDSDSAHPSLAISTDRKTVSRRSACPAFCNDSRRFYPSFCVLGSEGFTCGRHHWLVDVKGHCGWALGVAKESLDRKKPMILRSERGVWAVELGPYQLFPAGPVPEMEKETRRLLVTLDYEAGRVTFSDFPNPEPLFTFRTCFTEKLFPFFWLWSPEASIRLCP